MSGGNLGYTVRGSLVHAYEEAAYALVPGEISVPIRTQFGYHLIRLLHKKGEKISSQHILLFVPFSNADKKIALEKVEVIYNKTKEDPFVFDSLAIEYGKKHDIHIGNMGVQIDTFNESADISILIGEKEFWGSGLGTRAWNLLLNTMLNTMNFRLLTAGTMEINLSMIGLMKNSNMKIETTLKKRFLFENKIVGLVIASKLKK